MKIRENYTCPLEFVHDIIRGKWKTIIIFQLRNGKCSFSTLLRSINGISSKMLLEQLKELKEFKIINKTEYSGFPLKVDYFLTDRGHEILKAIQIMQSVGKEYIAEQNQSL